MVRDSDTEVPALLLHHEPLKQAVANVPTVTQVLEGVQLSDGKQTGDTADTCHAVSQDTASDAALATAATLAATTSAPTLSKSQLKNAKKRAKAKAAKAAAASGEAEGEGEVEEKKEGSNSAAVAAASGEQKKKKKSSPTAGTTVSSHGARGVIIHRTAPSLINANKAEQLKKQTSPPSIPVSELFKDGLYPEGHIMNYPLESNTYRITSEEKRALDRLNHDMYNEYREAAEVHRQTRADIMKWLKPGMSMIDIVQRIEKSTSTLVKADGVKRGWGFPT